MTRALDMATFGQSASTGAVLEQFSSPCNNSTITVRSGTYQVQDVSEAQTLDSSSFATINGSSISYKPPTETQTVKYDFNFQLSYESSSHISSYKLFLGSDEVEKFRTVLSVQTGSSWENIVDVTVFLTNMENDFEVYNRLYGEYFSKPFPTRTTVEINCLPTPIAIELKVIASV